MNISLKQLYMTKKMEYKNLICALYECAYFEKKCFFMSSLAFKTKMLISFIKIKDNEKLRPRQGSSLTRGTQTQKSILC